MEEPDIQTNKSKRELFGERLKAKYPEGSWDDDEALFGQIGDDYDEYEQKLGSYRDRESKLTDMMVKDPHAAQFITDMAQGKDPFSAFISRLGIEGIKEMLEDPEKVDEYAEKNREYLERVAKNKQLEDEWEENMQDTLQLMQQCKEERGLDDETIDRVSQWVLKVMGDAIRGIITPETLDLALKAINYDSDIARADQEGEVRGRNAKVEAKLRKPVRGDGTTVLGGANNSPAPNPSKNSIFELASQA